MSESEEKFKRLITEMEELIMEKVPIVKTGIIILENRERNEEMSFYEEIRDKEIKLDELRKVYVQIFKELIELDQEKAKKEIVEIIRTKKKLDAGYIEDLNNASGGPGGINPFSLSGF